jgi:molybdate transport system substrate-binding protein
MSHISLLSGGAAHGLVKSLAEAFAAETGTQVRGEFGAVGAMREKLGAGHAADIVILTRPIVDDLTRQGAVLGDTVADLGRVRTAVAVRAGDVLPDIGTAETLRAALLAADEIHFPDPALATAGIHFAKVLERLGIAAAVAGARRVHPNGSTAMRALAASTARSPVGCTQATEILDTPGTAIVGALPEALALETVYTAAVCRAARDADSARSFVDRLTGTQSIPQRRRCGFE